MLAGEMKRGTLDASLPIWVLGCDPSGPYSLDQVRAMWLGGHLQSDQQYCQEGMKTWCPLSDISGALDGKPAEATEPGSTAALPPPIRKSGRPTVSPSESSFERGYRYPGARRTLRFRTHL